MTIELVTVNGRLIGRRYADRWNLEQLGIISIANDRNHRVLKRVRRNWPEFRLTVVRNGDILPINAEELALLKDRSAQAA